MLLPTDALYVLLLLPPKIALLRKSSIWVKEIMLLAFPGFFKIQLKWLFTCFLMKYTSFRNGEKRMHANETYDFSYKKMLAKESILSKKVQIKKLLF